MILSFDVYFVYFDSEPISYLSNPRFRLSIPKAGAKVVHAYHLTFEYPIITTIGLPFTYENGYSVRPTVMLGGGG